MPSNRLSRTEFLALMRDLEGEGKKFEAFAHAEFMLDEDQKRSI